MRPNGSLRHMGFGFLPILALIAFAFLSVLSVLLSTCLLAVTVVRLFIAFNRWALRTTSNTHHPPVSPSQGARVSLSETRPRGLPLGSLLHRDQCHRRPLRLLRIAPGNHHRASDPRLSVPNSRLPDTPRGTPMASLHKPNTVLDFCEPRFHPHLLSCSAAAPLRSNCYSYALSRWLILPQPHARILCLPI